MCIPKKGITVLELHAGSRCTRIFLSLIRLLEQALEKPMIPSLTLHLMRAITSTSFFRSLANRFL